MQAPRRLQLRRGNTAAVSTYLGAAGELIVNTDTNTLIVHDGSTVGGIPATTNTAAITSNVSALQSNVATLTANAGVQAGQIAALTSNAAVQAGLIDDLTANAGAQAGAIITANTAMKGYVDAAVAGIVIPEVYGNANVAAYLTTNQYATQTYVNTANTGLKGYVDEQISSVNSAWQANAGAQAGSIATLTANAAVQAGLISDLQSNAAVQAGDIATIYANLGGVSGSLATLTSNAAVQAGLLAGLEANAATQSGQIVTANTAMKGYVDAANTAMKGYVDSVSSNTSYGNANVGAYLTTYTGNIGNVLTTANVVTTQYFIGNGALLTGIVAGGGTTYSNSNVASYLPTYSGNIGGNITIGGALTVGSANSAPFNTSDALYVAGGLTTVANISSGGRLVACSFAISTSINSGAIQTNGGIGAWGNVYAGENVVAAGNVSATYFIGNGALLTGIVASGTTYSNTNVAAYLTTYSGNIGNVTTTANITTSQFFIGNGSQITGISGYSNANVTSYLPTHSGNVGVSNIIGTTPNVTLQANSYSSTFDIYGNVAFGNTTHPVQTFTSGNITTAGNVVAYGIAGITMPNRPAFRINGINPGSQSTANTNLKGSAITTAYNQGNHFNASTGIFTAPIAGIYEVLLNARVNGSFSGAAQLVVLKNGLNTGGNIVAFWETSSNTGGATHFGVSGTVNLAAGDYLSANILLGNVTFDQNDNWCVTYLG